MSKHLASTTSYVLHAIYRLSGCPVVLLWEFEFARVIHLKQQHISCAIICLSVVIALSMLWFGESALVKAVRIFIVLAVSLFLVLHALYCISAGRYFRIYWMYINRVFASIEALSHKISNLIQKLALTTFQNSFMFNAHLLRTKLSQEITSYEQTADTLHRNQMFPREINRTITDFVFHACVQQMATERLVVDILQNNTELDTLPVELIVQFMFGCEDDDECASATSFQISYLGKGGNLSGKVRITFDENDAMRAFKLNVKYGSRPNQSPNAKPINLEYDLYSRELKLPPIVGDTNLTNTCCSK